MGGRRTEQTGAVDRRSRRGLASTVAAAVVAFGLVPVASVPAAADEPGEPPPWTCEGASVGETDIDNFVETWQPRLEDDAFIDNFLSQITVPDAILAEGYHDLAAVDQQCLISALHSDLATIPGFGTTLPTDAPGGADGLAQGLLFAMIFDKELTRQIQDPIVDPPVDTDPVTDELDDLLDALRVPSVEPLPTVEVPPSLEPPPPVTKTADELLGSLDPSLLPPLFVDPGGFVDVPSLPFPTPTIKPPGISIDALLATTRGIADSATYRVCTEQPVQKNRRCSPDIPIGTPWIADVDGNLVADVVAELAPAVDSEHPTGYSLQFSARRLSTAGELPGHVFAIFEVPNTLRQFHAGFFSHDSLADNSVMRFTLKDLQEALAGDVDTEMAITHQNPKSALGITFGVSELLYTGATDVETLDPISGFLMFDPVPTQFVTDTRFQRLPTSERFDVDIESSVASEVLGAVGFGTTASNSQRNTWMLVDKLSTQTSVDVLSEDDPEQVDDEKVTAEYSGAAPIDRVAVAQAFWPDKDDVDSVESLIVEASEIPTEMEAVVTQPMNMDFFAAAPINTVDAVVESKVDGQTETRLAGQAEAVPSEIQLVGDVDSEGDNVAADLTYTANDELDKLAFQMFDRANNNAVIDATVESVPPFIQAAVDKRAHDTTLGFDARSAPDAAPGSASVGPIVAKYTSNANFLTETPPDDHLVLNETGDTLQAELQYTGLARAVFVNNDDVSDANNDTIHAELQNSQPRRFLLQADTQNVKADAVVEVVPSLMTLDYERLNDAHIVNYDASSPIDRVHATVVRKSTDEFINATVDDVPTCIDLVVDLPKRTDGEVHEQQCDEDEQDGDEDEVANGQVIYESSADAAGSNTKVDAAARTISDGRTFDTTATVEDIPSHMELNYAPADDNSRVPNLASFRAGTPKSPETIGSITGTFTNHGSVDVDEAVDEDEDGQYALVSLADNGDLDASLQINELESFSFVKEVDGFTANVKAGDGGAFHAFADVVTDIKEVETKIKVDAVISALPNDISVTQDGDLFTYQGEGLYDLRATVAIGPPEALKNIPAPPVVRGVAARDGEGGALKLEAMLEGAPTEAAANLETKAFSFANYRPPATDPTFSADVVLDDDPESPIEELKVHLENIPEGGYDLDLNPVKIDATGDEKFIRAEATSHPAGAGPLTVDLKTPDSDEDPAKVAQIAVSNLPGPNSENRDLSFDILVDVKPDTLTLTGIMGDSIDSIDTFYREGHASNWQIVGALTDVPSEFSFTQQGLTSAEVSPDDRCAPDDVRFPIPTVEYTAEASTLDATLATDPSLFADKGAAIAVKAGITNLGKETKGTWEDDELNLSSTPKTDRIDLRIGGTVTVTHDFDAEDPCVAPSDEFISYQFAGDGTSADDLELEIDIDDAQLAITDLSSLAVVPGRKFISTGFQGDFGSVELGWDDIDVSVKLLLTIAQCINFGGRIDDGDGIDGCIPIAPVAVIDLDGDVDLVFHAYDQLQKPWIGMNTGIPCSLDLPPDPYVIGTDIKPSPITRSMNQVSVSDPAAHGGAFVVTPAPFDLIPDAVVDAATALFASPFDSGFDTGVSCG